ncbi:TetR family transcriptional regulator [Actinokineospora bangkokensis]|uniref:TetR family transcriptional regulator n=1 Tax=Actinokineospora bangkokensis TaxID=1193682 RepID=A0A1Q9LP84_9PSEU|nr:TetR family transcriptional regulator [Actinokineospora bangkokensis]
MAEAGRSQRAEQVDATRQLLLGTAERLFAEQGLYAVSNRQISAAAGQGNNAAVGYHFGTKADLVRAILLRHTAPMEALRAPLLERAKRTGELRDWVECLVRPLTDHLSAQDGPTWFARFCAQVLADPTFRPLAESDALTSPALQEVLEGLRGCLAELPEPTSTARRDMVRLLLVHGMAEHELAAPEPDWETIARTTVDAITGLLLAPVSPG